MGTNAAKNIAKLIQSASYSKNSWDVFGDCMEMMALSISNSVDRAQYEAREKRYMEIVGRYDGKEIETVREVFPRIMAELTMGLEAEPSDILGKVFEEAGLSNEARGQFFTPASVSRLMAEMQLDDGLVKQIEAKGFITAHEPACGSGGMVIAFAEAMRERGLNYQQQLHVTAIDVDARAAHMAYSQFSMLGIPAKVFVGNTLTLEMREVFYTPQHILGAWGPRLRAAQAIDAVRELTDVPEPRQERAPIEDVELPEPVRADVTLQKPVQAALFDMDYGIGL